jgi:hypothetical protein
LIVQGFLARLLLLVKSIGIVGHLLLLLVEVVLVLQHCHDRTPTR